MKITKNNIENVKINVADFKGVDVTSADYILSHLRPAVVGVNDAIFENEGVVYRDVLDLRLIYKVLIENTSNDINAAYTLSYNLIDMVGLTEQDLYEKACQFDNYFVEPIMSAIYRCLDLDISEAEAASEMPGIYVVTSRDFRFGASVLISNFLPNLAKKNNKQYVLLPSSKHELIMVEYIENMDLDGLRELPIAVNATEVAPEDILGNQIYLVDGNEIKVLP